MKSKNEKETGQETEISEVTAELSEPLEKVREDISEKRESMESEKVEKETKKRKRYKTKAMREQELAEEQQRRAMQQIAENALVVVFDMIDGIIQKRVKGWAALDTEEKNNLAQATNNVITKYIPDLSRFGEEFALGLVIMGIVGKRIPNISKASKEKDS